MDLFILQFLKLQKDFLKKMVFFSLKQEYSYSMVYMMLVRVEGSGKNQKIEFVGGVRKDEKETWFRPYLVPGNYILYVKKFLL